MSDLTGLLEARALAEFHALKQTLERLYQDHDVRGMIAIDDLGWPESFRFERAASTPEADRLRAERKAESRAHAA